MGPRSSRSRLAHQAPTGAQTAVCWPILLQTAVTHPEWRAFLPALARPPSAARPCPPAGPRAPRCENAALWRLEGRQWAPRALAGPQPTHRLHACLLAHPAPSLDPRSFPRCCRPPAAPSWLLPPTGSCGECLGGLYGRPQGDGACVPTGPLLPRKSLLMKALNSAVIVTAFDGSSDYTARDGHLPADRRSEERRGWLPGCRFPGNTEVVPDYLDGSLVGGAWLLKQGNASSSYLCSRWARHSGQWHPPLGGGVLTCTASACAAYPPSLTLSAAAFPPV